MSAQPQPLPLEVGIVEGYFGRPWSWAEREAVVRRLAPHGYRSFVYAPKADLRLRGRWREPYPDAELQQLAGFAGACRTLGVRFGVGLSPFEAYLDFDQAARAALQAKLAQLDQVGIDDLAILFDDMRGSVPDLAARQLQVVDHAAAHTRASRLIVCPTYYTDDPVLDALFGARPAGYLEALGAGLDPAVHVFWTGEEVCSREYGAGHLHRVAGQLGRRVALWDNYPVNDGPRMANHLHLRAFTGRPARIADSLAAHFINPALQPTLACIPALTLLQSYREGDRYPYGAAFVSAAREVLGPALAQQVRRDLLKLQDVGLRRLGDAAHDLRARYAAVDHPGAREIVDWLDGKYGADPDSALT